MIFFIAMFLTIMILFIIKGVVQGYLEHRRSRDR